MSITYTYRAPERVQDNASDDCGQIENQHDHTEREDDMVADQQIHKPNGPVAAFDCIVGRRR